MGVIRTTFDIAHPLLEPAEILRWLEPHIARARAAGSSPEEILAVVKVYEETIAGYDVRSAVRVQFGGGRKAAS